MPTVFLLASLILLPAQSGQDVREGPIPRASADAGIGRLLPPIKATATDGNHVELRPIADEHATVIALTSVSCPLSRKFAPLLGRLSTEDATRGVRWIFLDVTCSDTAEEFEEFAEEAGFSGDLVHDPKLRVAWALGCDSTTEALLVDRAGSVRYRGCVDDRYGLGYALDAPRITPLSDAVDAIRRGAPVALAATTAPGCALLGGESTPAETTPTYHGMVSRVIQANCLECHRRDGVAPFPLETYAQVHANAGMIKRVIERGTMPPWFAGDPDRHDHGAFSNDSSLPKDDVDAIIAWVQEGRPEGDPTHAPLPRTFPARWSIEQPDHVVRLPSPVQIKAEGRMPYHNVTVETGLEGEAWVTGWEVLPSNRSVVHHALVFVETPGRRRRVSATEGYLGAYVPGNGSEVYQPGFAKRLPAGSKLHFQIHYTPNGTACEEQLAIGLLLSDEPPRHEVHTIGIADTRLRIPAGAEAHEEGASLEIPADVRVLSITPHMHIRGSAFSSHVEGPGGETSTLLDVPRYDFNWQLRYRFADPPLLKAGTQVAVRGVFDNSSGNPANPDPEQRVRWGRQTDDEMLIGYFEYWLPDETIASTERPIDDASDLQAFTEQGERLIRMWDDDKDGRVSRAEVPENRRMHFVLIDLDKDGYVDLPEFINAARLLTR